MKLFLFLMLLTAIPIIAINNIQPEQAKEVFEIHAIMQNIAQINEYFTALGARNSSARHGAIYGYLKRIGTPTAMKVLKQIINNGDLPKHFLNMAQAYS